MNPSAGDTVIPTKPSSKTTGESSALERGGRRNLVRSESKPVTRKRRQMEPPSPKMEIPRKSPRHAELSLEHELTQIIRGSTCSKSRVDGTEIRALKRPLSTSTELGCKAFKSPNEGTKDLRDISIPQNAKTSVESFDTCCPKDDSLKTSLLHPTNFEEGTRHKKEEEGSINSSDDINHTGDAKFSVDTNHTDDSLSINSETLNTKVSNSMHKMDRETIVPICETSLVNSELKRKLSSDENEESDESNKMRESLSGVVISREQSLSMTNQKLEVAINLSKDKEVSGLLKKPPDAFDRCSRRTEKANDVVRLRKTIQWFEEGARRMREDLAAVRSELHEERKAAKLARRELDTAIREAKTSEAARNQQIISDLKARLSQSPSRLAVEATLVSSKVEFLKSENHRRDLSALKKRLSEAETTIRKLKTNTLSPGVSVKRRKIDTSTCIDARKLEVEVQSLRAANKKLEEKLHITTEAERSRTVELRIQHENHEAERAALQKIFRSETIKMMDEIRSKSREIEKLEKLVRKLRSREDEKMRKLRESERNHQIRLAPRIEEKITNGDHVVDLCKRECEAVAEVERLRELAVEQQEAIEVLRQAVKEKERKLEQLSNKKRKEEFYKQWLELEPVAEVDDEEENEEGDSALSSAPSSLSPQPGGCGQWQANGVTREAYESVLFEVEELQTKLLEEQRELVHAKSQVRDLEKALLQETRGSLNSKRALSDKLRDAEERESNLIAEISELREQNELLEFRVLELEESPNQRETPDPADSGIVSPEPIHLYKDQSNKHKDRAVATVIPYTSILTQPVSPVPQKPPLSLQESGIFEEEEETEVEVASCGTQTEAPAGELLQEVQRLQELRARIQERAVKVPPVTDTKTYFSPEVSEAVDIAQLAAHQERIHDLEERLCACEEAEKKFFQERQLSKQRDEELLDENYKLTEKIYWLENELRNVKEVSKENVETMLETKARVDVSSQCEGLVGTFESSGKGDLKLDDSELTYERLCQDSTETNFQEPFVSCKSFDPSESSSDASDSSKEPSSEYGSLLKDFETRIEQFGKTEYILRQQITVLERRERAFIETLRQADSKWSSVEMDYKRKYEETEERLKAQTELNRAFFEHLSTLNKVNLGVCSVESECVEKVDSRLSGVLDTMDVVDGIEKMEVEQEKKCESATDDKTEVTETVKMKEIDDNEGSRCHSLIQGPSISEEKKDFVNVSTLMSSSESLIQGNVSPKSWTEVAAEVNEDEEMEEKAMVPRPVVETKGMVSQISLASEERLEEQAEALITIDETEPEKKVRHKEREGWVMKTWNTNKKRVGSFGRDNLGVRNRRLILYQEICV